MDYSIVIPVYYNEGSLKPLIASLTTQVVERNRRYRGELIFVDDGSGDRSLEELRDVQKSSSIPVTIVKLTRNFGQASALLAGYALAKGNCVISMSADGQDPPELINEMLQAFFEEGYDVVVCAREGRDESKYRILSSRLFYFLMRKLAFNHMARGGFDFWLLSRRAQETVLRNRDALPFFQGHILWTGFRTKVIPYRRRKRLAGKSRLNFGKKYTAFLAGILTYSFAPVRIMSIAGIVCACLGFAYAVSIVIEYLLFGNPVKGWSPLMVMVLVLGGSQMLMLGVIGEYLWRTWAQVTNRDPYVVDSILEAKPQDGRVDG